MQVNEGGIDRIIRLAIAVTIIVLFFLGFLKGYWALLLIFSGSFLMSAFTGYCPLYRPVKNNSPPKIMRDFILASIYNQKTIKLYRNREKSEPPPLAPSGNKGL